MWSTAEVAITIMAASVPILRALLGDHTRKVVAARAQWLPKYRISWTDNLELQTRSTCVIEAGRGDTQKGRDEGSQSRDSAEDIEKPPPVPGTIVRTSIVTVVFEDPKETARDKQDALSSVSE